MPDIVSTAGSASANSFVTEDEFSSYIETRLNSSAYSSASTTDKQKAIIEATRDLSDLQYYGERVDGTQALSWPRSYAPNPDAPVIDTVLGDTLADFAEDEIPQRVKDATCELALQYLKAGTTDIGAADSNLAVIQKTIGPISTTYAEPSKKPQGLSRYTRVMSRIGVLLKGNGGLKVTRS